MRSECGHGLTCRETAVDLQKLTPGGSDTCALSIYMEYVYYLLYKFVKAAASGDVAAFFIKEEDGEPAAILPTLLFQRKLVAVNGLYSRNPEIGFLKAENHYPFA